MEEAELREKEKYLTDIDKNRTIEGSKQTQRKTTDVTAVSGGQLRNQMIQRKGIAIVYENVPQSYISNVG